MATGHRRRLSFREADEFLQRRSGRVYGTGPALGRLIHILWWLTAGKPRFVSDDARVATIRAEKKRSRQHRRRAQRQHR